MIESIVHFLRADLMIGFVLYSILILVVRLLFKGNIELLNKIDFYACKTIAVVGILYFASWFIELILIVQNEEFSNREVGIYWWYYMILPIGCVIITQLLRFRKFNKSFLFRILIGMLFLFTLEELIILVTTYHRDGYLTLSSLNVTILGVIFGVISKVSLFLLAVLIYYGVFLVVKGKGIKSSQP